MKIIGFCGLPGAGKTTAIEAVKDLGKVITMGDVIRNELIKRNIEPSDENLGFMAKKLRSEGGEEIIAEKCVELIKKSDQNEIIFIDGIRSKKEVEVFRKRWKFPIIAIELSQKLRYKRIIDRARVDDSRDLTDIKERDIREIGFGLEEVINHADFHVYNEGSIEELKKQTRIIVLKIINSFFGN
jgi:dephospho-CoA kinase